MTNTTIKALNKSANTMHLNKEIESHQHNIDELEKMDVDSLTEDQLLTVERSVQKQIHHLKRAEKANELDHDKKASYLTYLDSMTRSASGYDKDKIMSLIEALKDNSVKALNAGLKQAFEHIQNNAQKQVISVPTKNNVKSSMRLLDKLLLVDTLKDGRMITGYKIADAASLSYFLKLVK